MSQPLLLLPFNTLREDAATQFKNEQRKNSSEANETEDRDVEENPSPSTSKSSEANLGHV